MVNVNINGRDISVADGATILDATRKAGDHVPTLCHLKGLFPTGACRMCVVEVEGRPGLVPSCSFPAENGMKIKTSSPRVMNARRTITELLVASHPFDCLTCNRNGYCELQKLTSDLNLEQVTFQGSTRHHTPDFSSASIVRTPDKCILCGRCVRVCEEIQGVAAIDFTKRGFDTIVLPAFNADLSETSCINCGQCVLACPTGALHEVSHVQQVVRVLQQGTKYVIAQTAPAIRVSIGEFYGLEPGANVTGKLAAALRKIGARKVFDTDFTADLTIMEEGTELVERLTKGTGPLPLLTSCCPGWVKFVEHNYPEMMANLSSCKSPQQMMGALVKGWFAAQEGIKPEDIYLVSVMPCTAKKFEAARPEMSSRGGPDVDAVLTTREFSRILELFGVDFKNLPEEEFDQILGTTSGSGDIFAASGGVMESALRSAYNLITGDDLVDIEFTAVRGMEGVKEATVNVAGNELKIAVVNTLGKARSLMNRIKAGEATYAFVEVMACPGGCVGGGGQTYGFDAERIAKRMASIYQVERGRKVRLSYKNDKITALYKAYLEKPGSHTAHEQLHTTYQQRPGRR